jgi:hypothetical protein
MPLAAYRLHPASKTVAQSDCFEVEFDEIAKIYESHLRGSGRRWCNATLSLRRSVAASRAGRSDEAAREFMRALIVHPEGIGSRLFWGTLKALLGGMRFGKERPGIKRL